MTLVHLAAALALALLAGIAAWLAWRGRARARGTLLVRAFSHAQSGHGFDGALGAVLWEVRSALRARAVVLVAQDVESLRELLWSLPEGDERSPRARSRELAAGEREEWLFRIAADAWHAERQPPGGWKVHAVDADGALITAARAVPDEALDRLAERRSATALTGLAWRAGGEWEGRLLVFDARLARRPAGDLRFAQRLVRELGGIVHTRFLMGRV
ncbi:MAG TPA: hypothetical protein VFM88_02305, partial [Vicinamibacteria bacterium]|nr:hypothetical protein [Vicinamibacteria bacterium]